MKGRDWAFLIVGLLILGAFAPDPDEKKKARTAKPSPRSSPATPAAAAPEPRATPPTLEVTPYPGRATPAPTATPEPEDLGFQGDAGDWVNILADTKAHKRDRSGRAIPITVPLGVTRQILEANEKAVRIDEGWVLRKNLRAVVVSGGPVFTPLPVVTHTPTPEPMQIPASQPDGRDPFWWRKYYEVGKGKGKDGSYIAISWPHDYPPTEAPAPGLEWVKPSGRTRGFWRKPRGP